VLAPSMYLNKVKVQMYR